MSEGLWLYRWMDEFSITSEDRLDQHLRPGTSSFSRLQEIIESETWEPLTSFEGSGSALVAGTGIDLSGELDCSGRECQENQVDRLFGRVLHYFDEIVVSGPPAHNYVDLDPSDESAVEHIRGHASALLYVRSIGAERLLTFVQKPPACRVHYRQHAQEAGILDAVEQGRAWIDDLASKGRVTDLVEHGDHWHYTFDHPALRHGIWGSMSPAHGGPVETVDIAEDVYSRFAAHAVSDVTAAKQLGLPLGNISEPIPGANLQLPATSPSDVAFELTLPVLVQLPLREIVSIREHERESFEKFRFALREAIVPRIEAGETDPVAVAAKIMSEVISPALNAISLRLSSAQKILERKTMVSVPVATAITTVGLLTGVPIIAGFGLATLGTTVTAAHKFFEDKGSIEQQDMYFLWRLESQVHRR